MTIGTDTLATISFPGSNGAALPAGIAGGFGTWSQNGAAGCTYASGTGGGKYASCNPTRANDNYSIALTGITLGSATGGVFGRINGSGSTVNGYFVGDDGGGNVCIRKVAAGVVGSDLANSNQVGTGATEWLSQATISFDSDGAGGCVIRATSAENATVLTYTDVSASSPYLSGNIGLFADSTGTPEIWTGPITIKGTATGGATATVTPAPALVTVSGRAPATSAFQNVRIREVLVNESGQVVGGAANITLLVWYSGRFGGAPDVSLNGMTSDTNGTTSWSIATGTLAYNDPIAYVAQDSVSFSNYTCARMIPSYE